MSLPYSVHPPVDALDAPSESVLSADIAICSLPLPHPVQLGGATYARREYVLVRLTDREGREGFAFGYTRGLPLLPMLEHTLAHVIGTSPRDRAATVSTLRSGTPSTAGTMARATSLAEIALWDLAGKQAGLALAEFFGIYRREVPVMAVAGYFRAQRGDDAIVEEVQELEASGFRRVKLMLGTLDSPQTLRLVERVRTSLDDTTRLIVDAHYSCGTVEEATAAARALSGLGVSLLEDPFLPADWQKTRAISREDGIGIAIGEDVADPAQFLDLLEVATVLRVDPTTCGGIRAAVSGIEAAGIRGVPVLPHVFTSLSGQLAAAFPHVSCVEFIPPSSRSDPLDEFFTAPPHVIDGRLQIDLSPGVGMGVDWNEVVSRCEQVTRLT